MPTYKDAGVDIDAGEQAVAMIKPVAAETYGPQVLAGVGPFSGLFRLDQARYREPVLVASTDGVGTKVLLAANHGRHRSIGEDLVNHCVNDVLTAGASPLFFLDYIATGSLDPAVILDIVSGIAGACREAGCALIGGETAEMPDLYGRQHYDVAGFMVGACERSDLIDVSSIRAGDALLALPSSGLHTNGYTLARRVIPSRFLERPVEPGGPSVLEALLTPHRSYLEPVRRLRSVLRVKGLAHITGGGIHGNLPRILPLGTGAVIRRGSWPEPAIFGYLAPFIADEELWRAFNMGLGMIIVVAAADLQAALRTLPGEIFHVGEVISAEQRRVRLVE